MAILTNFISKPLKESHTIAPLLIALLLAASCYGHTDAAKLLGPIQPSARHDILHPVSYERKHPLLNAVRQDNDDSQESSFPASDDLPTCTSEQLEFVNASLSCIAGLFAADGEGECPEQCCCDLSAAEEGTIRTFVAVGSCAVWSRIGKSLIVEESQILPYTVESSSDGNAQCSKQVPGECEELIGKGCSFDPNAVNPQDPSPSPSSTSSESNSKDENLEEDEQENKSSGTSTRTTIALASCLTLLGCLIIVTVFIFIVRPFWRNRQSDTDSELDDITPSFGDRLKRSDRRNRGRREPEIDEELMALDAEASQSLSGSVQPSPSSDTRDETDRSHEQRTFPELPPTSPSNGIPQGTDRQSI